MIAPTRLVRGIAVPQVMYGTAWKEERTDSLVSAALDAGFRAIDTANQRKHYDEARVGRALRDALAEGRIERAELFIQTKFTYQRGQDHRLPYDPDAPLAEQVIQSFDSSCAHLGVDVIDSLVLHGPQRARGLTRGDYKVYGAMEGLHRDGRVRLLGVSNVNAEQLDELCGFSKTKPAFVQNRCYASAGWDRRVRAIADRQDVVYQGFSLLTANREVVRHREVHAIAAKYEKTVPQVIFRYAIELGMLPLTGTSDPEHMHDDLSVFDFELTDSERAVLENAGR